MKDVKLTYDKFYVRTTPPLESELEEGEIICPRCKGYGAEEDNSRLCKKCQGNGKVDWIDNIVGVKPDTMLEDMARYLADEMARKIDAEIMKSIVLSAKDDSKLKNLIETYKRSNKQKKEK